MCTGYRESHVSDCGTQCRQEHREATQLTTQPHAGLETWLSQGVAKCIFQRASILDVAQGSKNIQALPQQPTMKASIHSLTELEAPLLWGRAGRSKLVARQRPCLESASPNPFCGSRGPQGVVFSETGRKKSV